MIRRGEIWTVRWTGFASKPRPALVIQSEKYLQTSTDILALIRAEGVHTPPLCGGIRVCAPECNFSGRTTYPVRSAAGLLITSEDALNQGVAAADVRLAVTADEHNGLLHDSYICLDKLMAIPLANIDQRLGSVSPDVLHEVDLRLIKILGITL